MCFVLVFASAFFSSSSILCAEELVLFGKPLLGNPIG